MTAPAIRVEGLWKEYVIGAASGTQTFREALTETITAPFRRLRRGATSDAPEQRFWALQDVSFEVQPGEVVGIIGRNGAGKSTLLKILSRITAPTRGEVQIRGRIASLLEVGTGFHPELTGRENIRLNGAILGMTGAEIRSKFDEIVAFAGVEKFIDTPVKRYSSGMYVRLAFAVAAHLEPEILVIDEVLAVGDAEFQRKCLGKMGEVTASGRTVLFVSHNMSSINALCTRVILLNGGQVQSDGATREVTTYYSQHESPASRIVEPIPNNAIAYISSVELPTATLSHGDYLTVRCSIISKISMSAAIEVEIHDELENPLIYTSTAPMHGTEVPLAKGQSIIELAIGPMNLAAGRYNVYLRLIKPWAEEFHRTHSPVVASISLADPGGTGFEFRQSYGRGCLSANIDARIVE
jgi:lipopolysaccharide transport system ATP-binding protein